MIKGWLGEGIHCSNAGVCTSQGVSAQLGERKEEVFWANFLVLWMSEEKHALNCPLSASIGKRLGGQLASQPGWEIYPPTVQIHGWGTKGQNHTAPWSRKGMAQHLNRTGLFKPAPVQPFLLREAELKRPRWWRFPFLHRPRHSNSPIP